MVSISVSKSEGSCSSRDATDKKFAPKVFIDTCGSSKPEYGERYPIGAWNAVVAQLIGKSNEPKIHGSTVQFCPTAKYGAVSESGR